MSDHVLYAGLKRLASEVPSTRPHLVPLLRRHASMAVEASYGDDWDEVLVGDKTRIRIKGHWQHRVLIEELPQKGKRRLKRYTFNIGDQIQSINRPGMAYDFFMVENLKRDWKPNASQTADKAAKGLTDAIAKAIKEAKASSSELPEYVVSSLTSKWMPQVEEVNYLQVEPVDYAPVEMRVKDQFYVKAGWTKFEISLNNGRSDEEVLNDLHRHDPHYTYLVSSSAASARKFFKWIKSQEADVKRMTGDQLKEALDRGKIKYKYEFSQWR